MEDGGSLRMCSLTNHSLTTDCLKLFEICFNSIAQHIPRPCTSIYNCRLELLCYEWHLYRRCSDTLIGLDFMCFLRENQKKNNNFILLFIFNSKNLYL